MYNTHECLSLAATEIKDLTHLKTPCNAVKAEIVWRWRIQRAVSKRWRRQRAALLLIGNTDYITITQFQKFAS